MAAGASGDIRSTPSGATFVNLDGFSELGPDGRRGAGDADGWGGAVVTVKGTQLCFGITVNLISTPVAAHVHVGKPSESGPVVVGLMAPSSGDPGASSGGRRATRRCWSRR